MKKIYSTAIYPEYLNLAILFIRLMAGCFMLVHGIPKLEKIFSGEEISFADPLGMGEIPSLALTVFSEVFCSILIIIGCFTRLAVIPLIITMLVAVLITHMGEGFGEMEPALHFLILYILLLVTGSGKYSVDKLLEGRKTSA